MPITIARPYDEEELKREMGRVQARYQPGPMPPQEKGLARTVAETAGVNALDKGADKGTDMVMSKLGSMFAPKAAASGMLPGQLYSGMAPSVLATSAPGAASSGIMAGLSGAGSSAMAGLGALGPIGLGLGGIMLAKKFGLFNQGGSVGPLSPQYKADGGGTPDYDSDPIWVEWSHLYDDMNSGIITPNHPRLIELEAILQNKYGSAQHKQSGGSVWDGHRGPDYEDFVDWDGYRGPDYEDDLIDIEPTEGVPFNKGGNVQHKEHGGMMAGPLSNNKSVKIEKKETIEYKN